MVVPAAGRQPEKQQRAFRGMAGWVRLRGALQVRPCKLGRRIHAAHAPSTGPTPPSTVSCELMEPAADAGGDADADADGGCRPLVGTLWPCAGASTRGVDLLVGADRWSARSGHARVHPRVAWLYW
ncbi:hypothetical protein C1925_01370 [Stenotrophomonas sp. SAU14A_NAIMI4_5]|nr:hypothetical protein C1925_01370 [Stenotrophomonas sp. SAU14A_NAIMI4_5]